MPGSTETPDPRWPPMWRALGYRDFCLFFMGQGISLIGTWMQTVAEARLVYRLAGAAAHRFGAPLTVAAGGVMCVAGAAAYARILPQIREPARELIRSATAEAEAEEENRQG